MKRLLLLVLCCLPLLSWAMSAEELEVFDLVPLQIGHKHVQVQLADTPEKRAQGLMFQQSADPGMLLLYTQPTAVSLWMANTAIPLDVAYIGPNWTIAELITLQPFDETPVASKQPVIAALEMPRGWFARHGITIGQKVALEKDKN